MSRPGPVTFFRESLKSESYQSDEIINIYLLRPVAAAIVWLIEPMGITPNQVTVSAILVGIASGIVYALNTPFAVAAAGLLVTAKDVLDDADGQLARAKGQYSRRGRFLDSIGDFVADAVIFAGITLSVLHTEPGAVTVLLGVLSFAGITLRVSYHVYYQVSFLHLEDRYRMNRITEEITEEDRRGDPVALRLQQVFLLLYGWQDRLMSSLDRWCLGKNPAAELLPVWYSDRFALRSSGMMGLGTELALLAVCSLLGRLDVYLFLNVFLMNGILLSNILYRKFFLARNLR